VLALILLFCLLFFASVGLALRMQYAQRSETALAAGIFGSALLLVPVFALGLTSQLYRGRLILASLLVFGLALGGSFVRVNARQHARALVREVGSMLRLPFDGIRIAWAERGPALVAAVAVLLVLVWSALASYAAASDSWDGLGYHEPMIGYTIQEHSMVRPAVVPQIVFFEAINGNPRHCEMTALWMVMLLDRRIIDMPNTLAAPIYLLAVYLLCRRFAVDRAAALGWACAAILMPGSVLLLRSTYIDLQVAAFSLAAAYLCTRQGFRVRDAWPAAVAVGLMLGAKVTNLAWAPPLGLAAMVLLGRLAVRDKTRRGRILWVMAGALALSSVIGGVLYVRNLVLFNSPIWPFGLELKSLHLSFPGLQSGAEASREQHKPIGEVWAAMTAAFKPGFDYADTRQWGYGMAWPFLLLPLGVLAGLGSLVDLLRAAGARSAGRRLENESAIFAFAFLALYCLATAVLSPGLWQARYNLPVAALLAVGCARLGLWRGWHRLSMGALAVAVFTNLVYLYWFQPGLQPKLGPLWELLKLPAEERAVRRMNPWTLDEDVARARERLRPGELLVYTEDFLFIGNTWNEKFSNRIEWWPATTPSEMIPALERRNVKWVVTGTNGMLASALNAAPHWRRVGRMCHLSSAYERVGP
jgi:hypothetical protein